VYAVTVEQIQTLRKEYSEIGLDEEKLPIDPMELFVEWMDQAVASHIREPNAMYLSTVDADGQPHGRVVLLKEVDGLDAADPGSCPGTGSFIFYTNYESNKGKQLANNPKASICFWWPDLERQVRVCGTIEKISEERSTKYFHLRPRGSQLGAWASRQSTPISNRKDMQKNYDDLDQKFKGLEKLPKPDFWGGYRLCPKTIEFWKGRQSRFHDRVRYTLETDANGKTHWKVERLQP
jgi:pyridoxamine-phosphate oxidase